MATYQCSRYFPYLYNKQYDTLKIDETGKFSISCPRDAEFTTNVIIKAITTLKMVSNQVIITDGTAGVGGNTLSFEKHFYKVNAVELDKVRFEYLVHNMKVYNSNATEFYNKDYTSIYLQLTQDVVFLDPPWGGPQYKSHEQLLITLSEVPLETIIKNLLSHKKAAVVVVKLPLNYNYMVFDLCFPNNIKYKNKNMNIIVIYAT